MLRDFKIFDKSLEDLNDIEIDAMASDELFRTMLECFKMLLNTSKEVDVIWSCASKLFIIIELLQKIVSMDSFKCNFMAFNAF